MTTKRKRIWGWFFFDWASQPYNTLLLTFIFAPYIKELMADGAAAQSAWGFGIGAAGVIIALLAPILGALADISGNRLRWIWLFSGAYVLWVLAALYWVIDIKGWTFCWTSFFVVVGMNSIAAYFMGQLMKPFARGIFHTHLPNEFWEATGRWEPAMESVFVAAFFWLLLYWMFRNRVFIRV